MTLNPLNRIIIDSRTLAASFKGFDSPSYSQIAYADMLDKLKVFEVNAAGMSTYGTILLGEISRTAINAQDHKTAFEYGMAYLKACIDDCDFNGQLAAVENMINVACSTNNYSIAKAYVNLLEKLESKPFGSKADIDILASSDGNKYALFDMPDSSEAEMLFKNQWSNNKDETGLTKSPFYTGSTPHPMRQYAIDIDDLFEAKGGTWRIVNPGSKYKFIFGCRLGKTYELCSYFEYFDLNYKQRVRYELKDGDCKCWAIPKRNQKKEVFSVSESNFWDHYAFMLRDMKIDAKKIR